MPMGTNRRHHRRPAGETSDTQAVERRILTLNPEAGVSHIQPLHVRDQLFISTAAVDPSELADKKLDPSTGLERNFRSYVATATKSGLQETPSLKSITSSFQEDTGYGRTTCCRGVEGGVRRVVR